MLDGKIDNIPAIFKIEKKQGYQRIYLGDSDRFIEKGIYTFEIFYRYNSIIKSENDFHLLYLNITGNQWNYPILKVVCTIIFPEKIMENPSFNFSQINAYTSYSDQTEGNYQLTVDSKKPNILFFETTSPLEKIPGINSIY